MEAVILIGIQATGKTSFYRERFFATHVRINMDMLQTRHREALLLAACIEGRQAFVVDNTNPSISERARYLAPAKAANFNVTGYYFHSSIEDSLRRNSLRAEQERVLDKGIFGAHKRLQLPTYAEGFDALYQVTLDTRNEFIVAAWTQN